MARYAVYIAIYIGFVWGGCRIDGGDDVGRTAGCHKRAILALLKAV